MKFELRDNGDLVLFHFSGDPLMRLQKAGRILAVSSTGRLFDERAEVLSPEAIEAIRKWCEAASAVSERNSA